MTCACGEALHGFKKLFFSSCSTYPHTTHTLFTTTHDSTKQNRDQLEEMVAPFLGRLDGVLRKALEESGAGFSVLHMCMCVVHVGEECACVCVCVVAEDADAGAA